MVPREGRAGVTELEFEVSASCDCPFYNEDGGFGPSVCNILYLQRRYSVETWDAHCVNVFHDTCPLHKKGDKVTVRREDDGQA